MNTKYNLPQLKPCPYCYSENVFIKETQVPYGNPGTTFISEYAVRCAYCRVQGPAWDEVLSGGSHDKAKLKAATMWNLFPRSNDKTET